MRYIRHTWRYFGLKLRYIRRMLRHMRPMLSHIRPMLRYISGLGPHVEVHRTLGIHLDPRKLLQGKVQRLSKHQYMD